MLLPEPGDVPDANRLVEGGGDNKILFWMKLSAHGIVIMAGHRAYLAILGSGATLRLLDLLREPMRINIALLDGRESTYGSASSICEWSLIHVSKLRTDLMYAPTVVGAAHDPGQLVVEENGANVIQVAIECE